jgi:hypothetical protein
MQIPGEGRPDWNPALPSAVSDAIEKVREWTVRK